MKLFFVFLAAIWALLWSCDLSKSPNGKDTHSAIRTDSMRVADVDSLFVQIERKWGEHVTNGTIAELPINGGKDTLKFFEEGKIPPKVSALHFPDSSIIWITYYLKNDDLRLVRFREWRKAPDPMAREVMTYMEDGRILQVLERGKLLENGEPPAVFRLLPLEKSTRPEAEIRAEFETYWTQSKEALNDYYFSKK